MSIEEEDDVLEPEHDLQGTPPIIHFYRCAVCGRRVSELMDDTMRQKNCICKICDQERPEPGE